MLTVNNFRKSDVYGALTTALRAHDYPACCCAVAELACTRGEARNLLRFLLDAFASRFLSSNRWVVDQVASLLADLTLHAKKQKAHANEEFRHGICRLVLVIAQEKVKRRNVFRNPPPPPLAGEARSSKALGPLRPLWEVDHSLAPCYPDALPAPVGLLLASAMRLVDRMEVTAAAGVIQAMRVRAAKRDGRIQPASFAFVSDISASQRKDVMWYVWDALLQRASASRNPAIHEYVRKCMFLYTTLYRKQSADDRVYLWLYAMYVIASDIDKNVPRETPLLKSAARNAAILFHDTMGLPAPPCIDYLNFIPRNPISHNNG